MELLFILIILLRICAAHPISSIRQHLLRLTPALAFLSQNFLSHISAREFREKCFTQDTQHFCVASH
jgi:hypothetical protein